MSRALGRTWHLYYTALALMGTPESRAIFLFGSGAKSLRNPDVDPEDVETPEYRIAPEGHDLDLIVTVDPDVYAAWIVRVTKILSDEECATDCKLGQDAYHSCRVERLRAALDLLGAGTSPEMNPLYGWLDTLDSFVPLDVHLLPSDWQHRLDEIQQHLPHKDAWFMRKIAKDAILLADRKPDSFADWEVTLASRLNRLGQEDLSAELATYCETLA